MKFVDISVDSLNPFNSVLEQNKKRTHDVTLFYLNFFLHDDFLRTLESNQFS